LVVVQWKKKEEILSQHHSNNGFGVIIWESTGCLNVFFAVIIKLFMIQTNSHCEKYSDTFNKGPSSFPDVSEPEIIFLAKIIQMEHWGQSLCHARQNDKTTEQYWNNSTCTTIATPTQHFIQFLHFTDKSSWGYKTSTCDVPELWIWFWVEKNCSDYHTNAQLQKYKCISSVKNRGLPVG
jgi:hypothetical protein